jgi:pimeloyl-ACP methyl ester carboxylesterase
MTSSSSNNASAHLAFGRNRGVRVLAALLRLADRHTPDLAARLALDLFFAPLPTKLTQRGSPPPLWQMQTIEAGQRQVAVWRQRAAKPAGERPMVLLVHGWAGSGKQMLPLGAALAAAGMDPVLIDLPAHGRSDGWRCTMPQIVAALFAVQRRLGPARAIVAHSMGAVASLHAIAHGLSAERVVIMAPSSPPASVLRWFADTFGLDEGMQMRMRWRIETIEGMALNEFEAAWFAARVAVPTLVVHDTEDRLAPFGNAQALVRELPCARLHPLQGSSHRRMLSDPRVIDLTLAHLVAS